ncbi:hypothetical protein A2U01_0071700 [Trifolium medium]|uniref:Uncharacterized protein n=1 Tax=Trifolium medium TaxID=97028 RepID=A0A392SRH4_9FABA|nr:hypothetical protein [Trifolium medium]
MEFEVPMGGVVEEDWVIPVMAELFPPSVLEINVGPVDPIVELNIASEVDACVGCPSGIKLVEFELALVELLVDAF